MPSVQERIERETIKRGAKDERRRARRAGEEVGEEVKA